MVVICPGLSSGGVRLREATLSGVGCAGSIHTCFSQSQSPHPFTVEWWVSGKSSNTHLHGCALLGSSAFRGGEKCLHSGTFCYPIKHTAQAYGSQFSNLNLHLKYTAWVGGDNRGMQITGQNMYSILCKWEFVYGVEKIKIRWRRMKLCLQLLGDLLPIWEAANQVSTISQHTFAC